MGYLSSVFFKTGTADFGIAVGLDYMVNRDRKTWITRINLTSDLLWGLH